MPVEFIQALQAQAQNALARTGALRPGTQFETVVQSGARGFHLQFPGGQIPLDGGHGFASGQRVQIEVLQQGAGLVFRVTAVETPAASLPRTAPAGPLEGLIRQLGLVAQRDSASAIIPPALRGSETAARQLLQLFVHQGALSGELARLQTLLGRIDSGGGPLADFIRGALSALGYFQLRQPEDIIQVLRRMREDTRLEARLAALLNRAGAANAAELPVTLRGLLASLTQNSDLMEAAKAAGLESELRAVVGRMEERLLGAALQSGRNTDSPYSFVEVPLTQPGELEYLFLHFLPDRVAGARDARNAVHRVVLDVAPVKLGPLWIELRTTGDQGACTIQCRLESTLSCMHEARSGLESALLQHFEKVSVVVSPWKEAYLETVGRFASSLDRVDLNA